MTRYRTIVADPPWAYPEGFADAGANHVDRDGRYRDKSERTITTRPLPYPSMSVADIGALPIPDLADAGCRLFLWATNRYLHDALGLVRGWGFIYRQLIVWDKRPNVNPLGGSVAPNSAEYLIVAQRGEPRRGQRFPSSIINARKPRSEHSRKPDVFQDLIEYVSPGPYLELFARRQRLGWDTWGDEAFDHTDGALAGNGEARTAPAVPTSDHDSGGHA